MALVTVDAVVYVPANLFMLEVVGIVAAMAARALEDRVITTINVAHGALVVCVAMTGWKPGVGGMWERRSGPIGRAHAVAGCALCDREERDVCSRGMGWIRCPVVVALMTRAARVAVQAVVVVHVAVGTYPRRNRMLTHQCEARVVVIERGVCPVDRVMARLAGRWESGRGVCRAGRSCVVFLMA